MREYKCLNKNIFSAQGYKLVPIRDEDKFKIMDWRNEQIDILRQSTPLSKEQQENYFKNTVDPLFDQEKPGQILWSFLLEDKLIGYGGLVHINWGNKTAEISFLSETSRSKNRETFVADWFNYLTILKEIAAQELRFNKIFTYAYDTRPALYIALEKAGFKETERIKHGASEKGIQADVVIHSYTLNPLHFRFANETDTDLYYKWANDPTVRKNSFNSDEINYSDHVAWFHNKLKTKDCFFYLFLNSKNEEVGQVRIDKSNNETIIGISIDEKFRGHGFGAEMLRQSTADYFKKSREKYIVAYIKNENTASIKQFTKAGFSDASEVELNGGKCLRLIKYNHE